MAIGCIAFACICRPSDSQLASSPPSLCPAALGLAPTLAASGAATRVRRLVKVNTRLSAIAHVDKGGNAEFAQCDSGSISVAQSALMVAADRCRNGGARNGGLRWGAAV